MHIAVLSDSHGSSLKVEQILLKEKPDCFIFCGDGVSDILSFCDKYPEVYCHIVSGNCDRVDNFPLYKEFDMCGKHFFVTHGHMECVKSGYMTITMRAMSKEADILLFGHTHSPMSTNYGGIVILNPGSVQNGSYGVIDIEESSGNVKCFLRNMKEII
ncbi:MAG: YfcE family phosphodiesterase [Clostridia bacterium]|nr:YfcE family phosphodiesterase [Clostridia bacterium]